MIVAFFDFDGTITKKDSFLDFVVFTKGRTEMFKGILLFLIPVLGYKIGWVSGHKLKEKLITYFYKSCPYGKLQIQGEQYSQSRIDKIIRPKAIQRILWHKKQGHEIVVVTASLSVWIKPWCDQLNIKCIATEIAIENNQVTGKLKGYNCIGKEKVTRIKKEFDIKALEYIYAYGNSEGDKELLAIADEKFYCFF